MSEGSRPEYDGHGSTLAGIQFDLGETFQFLDRSRNGRRGRCHVDLYDVRAASGTRVGDTSGDGDRLTRSDSFGRQRDVTDREGGVRKSVPERKTNRQPSGVVPTMTDEESLSVTHLAVFAGEVAEGRSVFDAGGNRGRQSSARFGVTGQDIGHCTAHLLSTEPDLHDCWYGVDPRHVDGSPGVHQDDGVRIDGGNGANEFDLSTG